ncbi:hypothetical protein SAMN04487905_101315 [Actinopolyspora xinjiangensis]|uniref:Uncharacterized protein n=1 Tax=Actinopolyspora xinjiangensis TaxID=405564 RepID=A0A1H0NZA0_9ACTN|nr:hypothetical protein [Actinopolyspora xinjiangensis]SDO97836.1 hypothetical protein SAMN04487905_101315 [Actinopolyspora xinjiangensis]
MSALEELQQALRTVSDHLEQAQRQLVTSRTALHQAEGALRGLDPDNPETVVPRGMHRADDQIEHVLSTVEHVDEAVRRFATGL